MGDDYQKRKIKSTIIGFGKMYEIINMDDNKILLEVNENHIMTLYNEKKKIMIDI